MYYSGWQQIPDPAVHVRYCGINDADKGGFMATIHEMKRNKGLDLVLHTPGGEIAAVESLVEYLRSMFGTNIRVIIPHLAMSGGTMIALASKQVLMGKHSRLGPIDPQIGPYAAHAVLEEFDRAFKEIKKDPLKTAVWQPIIAKYDPTLIGECQNAIEWSREIVKRWLMTGMFRGQARRKKMAESIVTNLGDHRTTKNHARHITMAQAKRMGINVRAIEDDDALQDAVLSVHHACIQSISESSVLKLIENHMGVTQVSTLGDLGKLLSRAGPPPPPA